MLKDIVYITILTVIQISTNVIMYEVYIVTYIVKTKADKYIE